MNRADPWEGLPGTAPDLEAVRARIRLHVEVTPLTPAPVPPWPSCHPLFLKQEQRQTTGSFKLRGAAAFLTALDPGERRRGVIACSSGNHGRAVAFMAARLGIPATICVPEGVDPTKLQGIRDAGAEARLSGATYDEAEAAAEALAAERGLILVPPFDHPLVLAGQGTLGLEILDQHPDLSRVVVPLSGGGLAAGIGLALRFGGSGARLVAVSARNARVMRASVEAGAVVSLPEEPTLAGALAGGIGRYNRWTFPLVQRLVDEHLEVDEEEIARAMTFLHRVEGITVEGGGAVGAAALLSGRLGPVEGPTVVLLSGGNVDGAVLRRVLHQPDA